MEPLRPGDPRRIGPYHLIGRLDAYSSNVPVPEQRFLARSPEGGRTVLISTPLFGAHRGRFIAEAEGAGRQSGPWLAPVTEVREADELSWYASPYVPVVPLPAALAAHGGPLPERTVRALGAALAESLAALHASGVTHAGLSPAALLLGADGPRLTCFGAVRAAAPDGDQPAEFPGTASGTVPPEQLAGGRPQPPGDTFALGSVLSYAVTGHTVPERSELPEGLRTTISACLARDPAGRPPATRLLEALAGSPGTAGLGPQQQPLAPHGTVLDGGLGPAAMLLGPGWLPGRIIAAMARQSAEVLAADIDATTWPSASALP
ncbi:serine/threonine protein kinase [Streptomyces sp. ISL-11]|nr:serine/threonine protein kinase [Streptomyces sp. ISL-11]